MPELLLAIKEVTNFSPTLLFTIDSCVHKWW